MRTDGRTDELLHADSRTDRLMATLIVALHSFATPFITARFSECCFMRCGGRYQVTLRFCPVTCFGFDRLGADLLQALFDKPD
jgi:hypothetical protein